MDLAAILGQMTSVAVPCMRIVYFGTREVIQAPSFNCAHVEPAKWSNTGTLNLSTSFSSVSLRSIARTFLDYKRDSRP